MADRLSTEIIVKRRVRGGLYIYTCDELPGLFVVNQSDQVAYDDLPVSIQCLMKLDFDLDIAVTHKVAYADFVRQMRLSSRAREELVTRTDLLMEEENFERLAFAVHPKGATNYVQ